LKPPRLLLGCEPTVPQRQDLPRASLVEGIRFTAQVAVPNVVQGLFRRRQRAAAVTGRTGTDKLAYGFMSGLKRSYGDGPLCIRVAKDNAILLLGRDATRRVLEGSPEPFASDPEPKKSAMAHFQPDALTISREPKWTPRRRFTEAVLDTQRPLHRLADRFAAVAVEEAAKLSGTIDWERFNEAVRTAARRIILGEPAAEDTELSRMLGELMDKSNPPGRGDDELYSHYLRKLRPYVSQAAEGSLASLVAEAPPPDGEPAAQFTHWLFALGDTLAINAFRCLAVLSCQPQVHDRVLRELEGVDLASGEGIASLGLLGGCLHEAMRLWPTTPMLSRESTRDVEWNGATVPAGTQFLIVNSFNHRDREALDYADAFAPDEWVDGTAADEWLFNHFSHGPQGCPGTALAMLVGRAMLAAILRDNEVEYRSGPGLAAGKPLPYSLDFFGLRFELTPHG
jgi:cytochrome P450